MPEGMTHGFLTLEGMRPVLSRKDAEAPRLRDLIAGPDR